MHIVNNIPEMTYLLFTNLVLKKLQQFQFPVSLKQEVLFSENKLIPTRIKMDQCRQVLTARISPAVSPIRHGGPSTQTGSLTAQGYPGSGSLTSLHFCRSRQIFLQIFCPCSSGYSEYVITLLFQLLQSKKRVNEGSCISGCFFFFFFANF